MSGSAAVTPNSRLPNNRASQYAPTPPSTTPASASDTLDLGIESPPRTWPTWLTRGVAGLGVVVEPFGAHPSYAQGYYDRDNSFYLDWETISRDETTLSAWLDEWVYGLGGRAEYVDKLGHDRVASLRPGPALSQPVDYGEYR